MNEFDCHSDEKFKRYEAMRPIMLQKISEMVGTTQVQGIELPNMIRRLANTYDAIFSAEINGVEISGPRLAILIRLYVGELMGHEEGITPTFLSHMQHVTKNTISSLIRGLEEQGLIERENDPDDRRIYRIRLTEAGRRMIIENAPKHATYMNSLSKDLSLEELDQLIQLLDKLQSSIMHNSNFHRNGKFPGQDKPE